MVASLLLHYHRRRRSDHLAEISYVIDGLRCAGQGQRWRRSDGEVPVDLFEVILDDDVRKILHQCGIEKDIFNEKKLVVVDHGLKMRMRMNV